MIPASSKVTPISPDQMQMDGVVVVPRTLHGDARGFLIETHRRDDSTVHGDRFAMTYVSVTVAGEFRDRDRWHVHKVQTDRFVVAIGDMILALYDGRPSSPTRGSLAVIQMSGARLFRTAPGEKEDLATYLVAIPPGIYHCIGNLSSEPFILINSPTELYNPADEGRVPFQQVRVERLGAAFSWDLVRPGPASR